MEQLKSLFGAQDMTRGKPVHNLLKFSIPLLIGNIAQQLYSTVDTIIVGNYMTNGDNAVAAIGASYPIINLLLVLYMAISTGAGIMVAQYFGARQKDTLSKTVGTSLLLTFLSSIFIMIVGYLTTRPIMSLLQTPEVIYEMSCQYLTITFLGILGPGFYNIVSGILRGLGDSFMPLIFLLIACLLNIVLDIVFVKNLGLGVPGVAYATIISQFVSALLCIWRLIALKNIVHVKREHLRYNPELTRQLTRLGLPAGVTQGIFSMSMIVVQMLVNRLGADVITTTTLVMRVDGFAMLPNFTFGMAIATYVGQNIGAGNMERVHRGSRDALIISLITSVLLTVSILFFGRSLMRLFTQTEAIIELGMRQMKILAIGYIAMAVMQIYSGIMRGAGDTMPAMYISLATTVLIRVPVAYIWADLSKSPQWPEGSPDSLFYSLLLSWVIGAAANYLWYRRGAWQKKALVHTESIQTE